jgi:hypothetical protein
MPVLPDARWPQMLLSMRAGMPSRRNSKKFRNVRYGTYGGIVGEGDVTFITMGNLEGFDRSDTKLSQRHSKVNFILDSFGNYFFDRPE